MLDKLFFWFSIPFYIPHYFLFIIFKNKYLQGDFNQWVKVFGLQNYGKVYAFFVLIIRFREYRTVFYYRIGGLRHFLSWYSPGMPTCFILGKKDNIAPGLIIQHGHSSRIAPERAGKNLQVWHNVTIGKNKSGGKRPIIGDNVKVMTNSLVFGDITVGDNVVIGAGTIVYKNIPSNCVVVGNPARIVKKDGIKINIVL